jgi:hypothetical protein
MPFLRALLFLLLAPLGLAAPDGAAIYVEHCASCHGDKGQGVAKEYDEALVGKKSIQSLAKYIHRTMPEDDEDAVIDEDARLVAEYIHRAFYSPEAQGKLKPVRRDLLRLTQHQHRRALADIVANFRWRPNLGESHGLSAEYFNKEKMDDRKGKLAKRIDQQISFDLASDHGVAGIDPKGFSIFWRGSLLPPETGTYQFRLKTPNGARLWLNHANSNDEPTIDAWVSSGNVMRESTAAVFLLGGHTVPLELHFISYQEKVSSVVLEWKTPHGAWEAIPSDYIYPESSPRVAIATTSFPPDDASMGYERGSSISKAWRESVTKAAIEIAGLVFDDIDALAKTKPDQKDRLEKHRNFCADFAGQAFSRPLTNEQRKTYIDDIFAASSDDSETAVKRSLMLTLTSPYFLYPSLNLDAEGKSDLYTRALYLSLQLWDSIPDRPLEQAAAKGWLAHDNVFQEHIERMLKDPRAKEKMQRFFFQWLNLNEKDDLTKDNQTFPGFDEVIIADLRASFSRFLNETVWSEQSDYRQLFNSPKLPLTPRLEKLYQQGSNPAGLLTHPYILTAFSYHKQTSPIHRGVYLSRNVLGRFLKPPPKAIEFKDADFNPHLTMRQKVTELTKDESCMACHSIINPIGFSLENYDAIGRFRTHEQDKPIDTTSDYATEEDDLVKITGPKDLAKLAVESPGAHRAFIKHLFHHLAHQPVNSYGFSRMDELHDSFQANNFNIQKLIAEIARITRL